VILQKVIFWGKITFSTKKNVGGTYFCQPKKKFGPESHHMTLIFVNLKKDIKKNLSWGKNVSFDSF
jgi:hypothetical protein